MGAEGLYGLLRLVQLWRGWASGVKKEETLPWGESWRFVPSPLCVRLSPVLPRAVLQPLHDLTGCANSHPPPPSCLPPELGELPASQPTMRGTCLCCGWGGGKQGTAPLIGCPTHRPASRWSEQPIPTGERESRLPAAFTTALNLRRVVFCALCCPGGLTGKIQRCELELLHGWAKLIGAGVHRGVWVWKMDWEAGGGGRAMPGSKGLESPRSKLDGELIALCTPAGKIQKWDERLHITLQFHLKSWAQEFASCLCSFLDIIVTSSAVW